MLNKSDYHMIQEIELINNKKIIVFLNILSILILLLAIPFFILLANLGESTKMVSFNTNSLFDILLPLLLFLIAIIIHELIHAFFMKLFNKDGKVKFGFKNGMAYATSPNSLYSKKHFTIISLAPFVLITITLSLLYYLGFMTPFIYVGVASIHASGCVGDFYWVYLIKKAPANSLIEDTETGINFYGKND